MRTKFKMNEKKKSVMRERTAAPFEAQLSTQPVDNLRISQEAAYDVPLSAWLCSAQENWY